MSAKQPAGEAIEHRPDDCTMEEIQQELFVSELLQKRVAQADAGKFATDQEVEKRLARGQRK